MNLQVGDLKSTPEPSKKQKTAGQLLQALGFKVHWLSGIGCWGVLGGSRFYEFGASGL